MNFLKSNRLRFVIVEDNSLSSYMLSSAICEMFSCYVETYSSVEELFERVKDGPDFILLDHHLEGMDGIDALDEIRARYRRVKIIVVSSQLSIALIARVIGTPGCAYLRKKDFTAQKIAEIVDSLRFPAQNPDLFIIDDNRLSQLMLGAFVNTRYRYHITDFESAEDCLKYAKGKPHVILLDYGLKGMNGLEAIPKLRQKWPSAQIVVVSSQRDEAVVQQFHNSGIAYYVDKNEDLERDLFAGIERAEEQYRLCS